MALSSTSGPGVEDNTVNVTMVDPSILLATCLRPPSFESNFGELYSPGTRDRSEHTRPWTGSPLISGWILAALWGILTAQVRHGLAERYAGGSHAVLHLGV